jgi:hypothetical protein
LLKETEMTKVVAVVTVFEDRPKKAIDAEVAKIVNKKWCASIDPSTASYVPGTTSGDAGQEEEVEAWN